MARVGHHENEHVEPRVALLESHTAFQGLEVPEAELHLEADRPPLEHCPRVQGPEVAGNRQRDLGGPGCELGQSLVKTGEKPKMAGIAHRLSVEVGPRRELQTDGRGRETQPSHGHVDRLAALEPAQGGAAQPDRGRRFTRAQASRLTCEADLMAGLSNDRVRSRRATIEPTHPAAHARHRVSASSPAAHPGPPTISGVRLVDSHCHLQADRFDDDRDEVIARASLAGVERILVPGWDEPSSRAAIALSARHEWLNAAVGIHPHDAARADDASWQGIVRLARDRRVVAIGETGLDYDRMFSPAEAQLDNLRRHLELGLELGKPVILHCRSAAGSKAAHDALLEELDRAGMKPPGGGPAGRGEPPPAVMHSFSGSAAFAEDVLARGLAISISGLAFRTGEEATFADVVPIVPADRLMVETDSPYLSPPGAPRRRNEPEWVRLTAEHLAEARDVPAADLGAQLVAAYDRTFRTAS